MFARALELAGVAAGVWFVATVGVTALLWFLDPLSVRGAKGVGDVRGNKSEKT